MRHVVRSRAAADPGNQPGRERANKHATDPEAGIGVGGLFSCGLLRLREPMEHQPRGRCRDHGSPGQRSARARDATDFDFHGHRGYGIVHRKVDLDLPANYEFTFAVRGEAPTNTLEFKLVDTTGANVWWSNNANFIFPREWRTIARKKRQICFAWGPAGGSAPFRYDLSAPGCRLGIDIHRVAAIEFAITAGSGGKGSVWIDDLSVTPLDPDSPHHDDGTERPDTLVNTPTNNQDQTRTYFEFQVEKPATMLDGGPTPKYPRELERSGLGGEVQAQFVVMSSGKVDMDSFKVLKSTNGFFTRAVRNGCRRSNSVPR